jgi:hypothetical protein
VDVVRLPIITLVIPAAKEALIQNCIAVQTLAAIDVSFTVLCTTIEVCAVLTIRATGGIFWITHCDALVVFATLRCLAALITATAECT